jgi:ABC-type glycerol-3-phosphate transport system permease component
MTRRFNPAKVGVYALLVFFAIIFLVPVYVVLVSSLKTFSEV